MAIYMHSNDWRPWDSTLAYYTFNDQNSSQITDFSFNWKNLTWWTMPSYVLVSWTDYAGNYANTDTTSAPYVSFWTSHNLVTVLVWAKPTANGQCYISYVWRDSSATDDYQNWIIRWYNSWQIEYYESKTNSTSVRATIKSWVSLNTRYLVWYTRTGNSIKTYVNWTTWWTVTWISDTWNISFYLWCSNLWWRFKGQIWECIIEYKIWTIDEILEYYNSTKSKYWL